MVFLISFVFGLFMLAFDYLYTIWFLLVYSIIFLLNWGGFSFGGVVFIDGISFFLIFLTVLLLFFCNFAVSLNCWSSDGFKSFMAVFGLMSFLLVLSFTCFSILLFYMSFELIFILMFFFVLNWGYSSERLSASFYMIFYTLVVSFPFLVYISLAGVGVGKFLIFEGAEGYWWLALMFVFLVKLPVYGLHLWLPKAHVEAPISGSMLLAGVLLKLGLYGFFRFNGFLSSFLSLKKGYLISSGVWGGLISSFLCLRQADLKAFVAYSSVCHMGYSLAGLFSFNSYGFVGSVFMMIAHGFCSSCLFYILYVFYERFSTRSLMVLKGVGYLMPMLSLIWFLFSILNMGVPPFFSFFSEVLILGGVGAMSFFILLVSSFLLFFSGLYGIFFFVIACHSNSFLEGMFMQLSMREFLNFFGHFFYMLFFSFSLNFFFL